MSLVAAAFGRFPLEPDRISARRWSGVTGLGIVLLIVGLYDLLTIRRIHRSTAWAAPLTFACVAVAVPIGMTAAWHTFAALVDRTIGLYLLSGLPAQRGLRPAAVTENL